MNDIIEEYGLFYIASSQDLIGPFKTRELAETAVQGFDKWEDEDNKPKYRKYKENYDQV